MKKFLSILLSISMVLGLLTSTAYANNVSTKHSATKFESIGHGEFRIAPSNSIVHIQQTMKKFSKSPKINIY